MSGRPGGARPDSTGFPAPLVDTTLVHTGGFDFWVGGTRKRLFGPLGRSVLNARVVGAPGRSPLIDSVVLLGFLASWKTEP